MYSIYQRNELSCNLSNQVYGFKALIEVFLYSRNIETLSSVREVRRLNHIRNKIVELVNH